MVGNDAGIVHSERNRPSSITILLSGVSWCHCPELPESIHPTRPEFSARTFLGNHHVGSSIEIHCRSTSLHGSNWSSISFDQTIYSRSIQRTNTIEIEEDRVVCRWLPFVVPGCQRKCYDALARFHLVISSTNENFWFGELYSTKMNAFLLRINKSSSSLFRRESSWSTAKNWQIKFDQSVVFCWHLCQTRWSQFTRSTERKSPHVRSLSENKKYGRVTRRLFDDLSSVCSDLIRTWLEVTFVAFISLQMAHPLPFKLHVLPLLLASLLTFATSAVLGLLGHFSYWLLFDSFGRGRRRDKRKLKWINNQRDDEYYTVIIGTGFSGLGMAIKLNQLGMDNYILVERHSQVGGTWYANTYPGCACDVPSNLYSFSFEPNPKWSYYFSRQPEIAAYLEYCTDKYDIRRHIQFNTTVTEMRWIEERQLWEVLTESNGERKRFLGRSIVLGSGPLSNASYPTDIAGIEKFEGQMCHTATWDKSIDFRNKRVAVIGTGASAIQAIPEIQAMGIKQLLVFQRTPPWTIPRVDRQLNQWEKDIFRRFPLLQKLTRVLLYWVTESFALAFVYRWPLRFINQLLVRYNLDSQVKDAELRRKLTPNWEFGCKRMLLTNDWYSTLQKPNVQLVINRIREVKAKSLVTYDGNEYPLDVIIWSTGFQTQTFPLPVYGVNGQALADQWSKSMQVRAFCSSMVLPLSF